MHNTRLHSDNHCTVWYGGLETTPNLDNHNLVSSINSYFVAIYGIDFIFILYSILIPLQAIGILIWYVIDEIIKDEEEKWYGLSRTSLLMVLTQVCDC